MIGDVTEERGNGTLEFSVNGGSEDDFFPASVEFVQNKVLHVSNYTIA